MEAMAQQLEAIRRKQQPVSSEVFWQQVEAFQDQPEVILASSTNSALSIHMAKSDANRTV